MNHGVEPDEHIVPWFGRCPECGNEVMLRVMTWEGFWAVRPRPHQLVLDGIRGGIVCAGAEETLKKGKIS